MSKSVFALILSAGLLSAVPAAAESGAFREAAVELPALPDTQSPEWFELYIAPTRRGSVLVLRDSIRTAEDGSIRYLLNRRSAAGYDNISAEGLLCVGGRSWLGSEGPKVKTFAYADVSNRRWIEPRQSEWTELGGRFNRQDPVRGTIYDALCSDGKTANDEQLRQRLNRAAFHHRERDEK